MDKVKHVFMHFGKIVKHKWYVMLACFKCGLIWQGLTHDLSKFSPVEFFSGVKYFKGIGSPIGAEKSVKGYSEAWQHHKGRNKHHWEYWTDFQHGKLILVRMPPKYVAEMLCDWVGASKAYNSRDKLFPWTFDVLKKYYEEHIRNSMYLHTSTKRYIDMLMANAKSEYDLFYQWINIPRIQENYNLDEIEGCAHQDPLSIFAVGIDFRSWG